MKQDIKTRDVGTQLLYCGRKNGKWISALNVKQLFDTGVPVELDRAAIPAFLMYQYSMGGNTLFGGIKITQWNQIVPERGHQLEESALVERLRELIHQSINNRTLGAEGVSLLLSGGIDSSTVGTMAVDAIRDKMQHAFAATFDTHSEFNKAARVAELLKLKLHRVHITADMVAKNIENITATYEEPLGDAALINNYFLSKAASLVSDAILSGDGGDEIFGGYPWHHFTKYIPLMNKTPIWARKLVQRFATGDPTTNRSRLERVLLFPAQVGVNDMILYPTTAASYQNIKWLLKSPDCSYDFIPIDYRNIYNKMLAMDCFNFLPNKFGMDANKFFPPARHSPLIDKYIMAFAFSLPTRLRKDKYILRKTVENVLPPEIVWGRKAGFGTPVADWLNSDELKPMVLDKLENGKLLNEICNKQPLNKLVEALRSGKINSNGALALNPAGIIWGLFALQVWHDVWFEK